MSARVRREVLDGGIHRLGLERGGPGAPALDREAMADLEAALSLVEADPSARGLLLSGGGDGVFLSGADLVELDRLLEAGEREALRAAVRRGQALFGSIAALHVPTAAAIHGACLGGGLELALACDWILASDDPCTRLGFPETRLGLLPAWGGTARLPRRVGLSAALRLLVEGRTVRPREALRLGLVDAVVPPERLAAAARERLAGGKARRRPRGRAVAAIAAPILRALGRRRIRAATRGLLPAPLRALDVALAAARLPEGEALRREEEAFLDLAAGPAPRRLVRLALRRDAARGPRPGESGEGEREALAVLGAGVMGSAVAQWASARGHPVLLRDVDDGHVRAGMASVAALYGRAVRGGALDPRGARRGLERVRPSAAEDSLRGADVVLEAVAEDLGVKRDVLRRAAATARPDALLATNTSSLSVDDLAEPVPGPGRVLGIHFFHPVHRMDLVEVVAGTRTDRSAVERAVRLVRRLGKTPLVVRDRPGFAVNRVLAPYLLEAVRLVEEGVPVEAVDDAMLDFGMPMGPLRLLDEVGLDVAAAVAISLERAFGGRLRAPELVDRMRAAGRVGRKSGTGFYRHRRRGAAACGDLPGNPGAGRRPLPGTEEMRRRMVHLLVNEAARIVEEGVVEGPEDADLALVLGAGFAPFRGGPLRHADDTGPAAILDDLDRRAAAEARFAPCGLLRRAAWPGGGFHRGAGVEPRGPIPRRASPPAPSPRWA